MESNQCQGTKNDLKPALTRPLTRCCHSLALYGAERGEVGHTDTLLSRRVPALVDFLLPAHLHLHFPPNIFFFLFASFLFSFLSLLLLFSTLFTANQLVHKRARKMGGCPMPHASCRLCVFLARQQRAHGQQHMDITTGYIHYKQGRGRQGAGGSWQSARQTTRPCEQILVSARPGDESHVHVCCFLCLCQISMRFIFF